MRYTLPVLLALVLLTALPAAAQSHAEEHAAIARTVNYYLVGGTNNDYDTLKKAFHETATMRYIRDGEYRDVNALEFFSRIKPGPPSDRRTRITSIDVAGDAAIARLEIEYDDVTLVDYMQLLKIDGEWKIVGKIFASMPKGV